MPKWLENAVFYEIYPQSFCDSNGDGIGDIQGIITKLSYIKELGCNALWINPIYDSPFMDAGYDVRDHKKVAERYGTLDDVKELLKTAHDMGIKVLFDLVPGHTSDTNEWFLQAKKAEKNECSDRYIFTDCVWEAPPEYRLMCGICERDGNYLVNYFSSQPALNYGFYKVTHPKWQISSDSIEAQKTVDLIKDIMRYWLSLGVDGFRVDMADSLVKNDDEKFATAKIWAGIREMMDKDYPECALVSEWCNPQRSIVDGGFHMDFYLDHYGNGYSTLFRYLVDGENKSFFSDQAQGDISTFLDEYKVNYPATKDSGYICFMTNNHDMPRATYYMSEEIIKLTHAFMMTMPGVPFVYYGDEIGMRYQTDLVSKEGGFSRTGSRTPMQWDSSKNLGFSTADESMLYLPVDKSADAPTVLNNIGRKGSIYENLKTLIALRHENEDLRNGSDFKIVHAKSGDNLLMYTRGDYLIVFNVGMQEKKVHLNTSGVNVVYSLGEYDFDGENLILKGRNFILIK